MNWSKGRLLETSGNYWQSCTLHAGVKLDIFTHIGSSAKTAKAIADQTNCNIRGLSALLNALTSMGLLTKKGDSYSNTEHSLTYLSKESNEYTGFIILHHHHLMSPWSDLSSCVKSGKPNRKSVAETDEAHERESFLMGMFNIASTSAPLFAQAIDLSTSNNLLDMGGGPGTYAIHFCLQNPHLKATVFDLPSSRSFAEKTIDSFGLSNRITFHSGSYLEENTGLEKEYDVAWLSHILHGEGPEEAERIVAKAAQSLRPGGTLLIHEFILDNSKDAPLFPALFSLNMLVGTEQGQSYSELELKDMLNSNGIENIKRYDITTPNSSGIIGGILKK